MLAEISTYMLEMSAMPEIRSATFCDSIHRMSFVPQWSSNRACRVSERVRVQGRERVRSTMSPEMAGNRRQSTYPFCFFIHNLSHIEADTILISISSTRVLIPEQEKYKYICSLLLLLQLLRPLFPFCTLYLSYIRPKSKNKSNNNGDVYNERAVVALNRFLWAWALTESLNIIERISFGGFLTFLHLHSVVLFSNTFFSRLFCSHFFFLLAEKHAWRWWRPYLSALKNGMVVDDGDDASRAFAKMMIINIR